MMLSNYHMCLNPYQIDGVAYHKAMHSNSTVSSPKKDKNCVRPVKVNTLQIFTSFIMNYAKIFVHCVAWKGTCRWPPIISEMCYGKDDNDFVITLAIKLL